MSHHTEMDIFLSYAREDLSRAKNLVTQLESRGWSVWWDRTIPPGQSFAEVIERELHAARCVIVLWSSTSVGSSWVRDEATEARARGVLMPVLLDEVKMPMGFRQLQAAHMAGWDGVQPHPGVDDLLAAVGGLVTPASVAPVTPIRDTPRRIRASTALRSRQVPILSSAIYSGLAGAVLGPVALRGLLDVDALSAEVVLRTGWTLLVNNALVALVAVAVSWFAVLRRGTRAATAYYGCGGAILFSAGYSLFDQILLGRVAYPGWDAIIINNALLAAGVGLLFAVYATRASPHYPGP